MTNTSLAVINNIIREAAHPVTMASEDYDPLIELIGDAHFVLIGEASHGTHEFYQERASITKRLITEKGFTAVAVEADHVPGNPRDGQRPGRSVGGRCADYQRGREGDQQQQEAPPATGVAAMAIARYGTKKMAHAWHVPLAHT